MTELIGQIAGSRGLPESPRDTAADLKIADQRFAAGKKAVREQVPGTDLELAGFHQLRDSARAVGPHFEVILEHDRLTVEVKTWKGSAFEKRQHLVRHREQPRTHPLKRLIPLAIPVRVNDEIKMLHEPRLAA